jgi:DNA polymerase III subunit delta
VAPSGEKLDRGLADHAVAVEFPVLGGDRLPRWIAHRAGELGVPITPEATALLQEAVGTDLAALASELDKLTSYARGRIQSGMHEAGAREPLEIDEAAVAAVVGVRRGETMGALLDRVAERDPAGALALVEPVLAQPKVSAVGVVMALATQTLALAWGHTRRSPGASGNRLAPEFFSLLKETGANPMRPWGEAVATWARTVDRWTMDALDRALDALAAADAALKETRMTTDEQVVATLVLAMCADVDGHRAAPSGDRQEVAA